MAGIIEQAAGGQAPGQPPEQPPVDRDALGTTAEGVPGAEEPTGEEQDAYDRIMAAAMTILYDDQTHQGIVQQMALRPDEPELAMAEAVIMVLTQIDERSNGTAPVEWLFVAVGEVAEQITDIAAAAGVFSEPIDEAMANRVAQEAMAQMGAEYDIDPEELRETVEGLPEDYAQQIQQQQSGYATVRPERQAQPVQEQPA